MRKVYTVLRAGNVLFLNLSRGYPLCAYFYTFKFCTWFYMCVASQNLKRTLTKNKPVQLNNTITEFCFTS